MKKILLIIGVLISVVSFGQPITPQTGYVSQNMKLNLLGLKAQNELGIPVRDTNSTPAYVGELRYKSSDQTVYIGVSTSAAQKWVPVGRTYQAGWGLNLTGTTFRVDTLASGLASWNRLYKVRDSLALAIGVQDVIDNDNLLTSNSVIDMDGKTLNFDFDGESYVYINSTYTDLYRQNSTTAVKWADVFVGAESDYSSAAIAIDSANTTSAQIFLGGQGTAGKIFIQSTTRNIEVQHLPSTTVGPTKWMVTYDTVSRKLEYAEIPDGGGSDDLQDVTDLGNETDNDIISTNNSGFRVQESATDLAQLGKVNGGSGAAAGGYISLKSTGSGAGKALVMPTASWAAGTKTAFLHYNDGDTLATKADIRNAVGTGTLMVPLTDAATITVDASQGATSGATYKVTLGGNRTIANPTNLTDGQIIRFKLKQDGTGTRTVTWSSKYVFSTDTPAPTLSTAANAVDIVAFVYDSADDKLYVMGTNIGH